MVFTKTTILKQKKDVLFLDLYQRKSSSCQKRTRGREKWEGKTVTVEQSEYPERITSVLLTDSRSLV